MNHSTRPLPAKARDYSFPRFEQHKLDSGVEILVAPVDKLPLVTIHAVVDAGGETDPAGKEGLAQLTARLLAEGTSQLDAVALTERMELLGTSLSTSADWDCASVSVTLMKEKFAEGLTTLADVIMRPAFPERELARLKAERLAELLQMRTEPRSLADEMFAALLYDHESRYSAPLGGWEESVRSVTLEDARQFHAARYGPTTTTILIVGDVVASESLDIAQRVFGGWRSDEVKRSRVHATPSSSSKRFHLIAKDGAPQSELRIGHIGLPRLVPDYFNVTVLNAILGGLFSSRVNLNLRERRGYTYGASSHFDWRHEAGPFVVATAVKSDVTAESISEVLLEIERMRSELVTESELSLAINYLTGVFPIRFETTSAIASALAAIVVYDLPKDYFDSYRSHIGRVTRERIMLAATQHLKPEELNVVVVGDPAIVSEPLNELSGGSVSIVDAASVAS